MNSVGNPFKLSAPSSFGQPSQVLNLEYPLTKTVIELIKREASLNCPICFLQFDSSIKYPVQVCSNKHIICRVCVDKLKPITLSQSQISGFSSRNSTRSLCPTCKLQFLKENVQRNRVIQNIAVEVIPKITSTLQDHIELNKNLQAQRQKEIRSQTKMQIERLKKQCNIYRDQCNIYRGLPELSKINSLTIKLLSQENDNLKQELKGLQNQILKNYSLFPAHNLKTKANTSKSSRDIQKLTEKQIKQKIQEKKTWKVIDNKIYKYFHFISTVNIDVLHTLELKGIGMNNAQFVILLRIEFKSLRKLVLKQNSISMEDMDYYLQNIKTLKELDLSYNQINHIPCNLSQLQQLETLDLQHNQLTQISKSILQLPNLSKLYLKNNRIPHFSLEKIQFVSKQIQILQVDSELIKKVFPILKEQNLKSLTVSDQIPSTDMIALISQKKVQSLTFQKYININHLLPKIDCQKITSLKFIGNLIRRVSLENCKFSSLKKLNINQPFLVQIPTVFVSGGSLQKIDIKCQQVTDTPSQLQSNTNLRQIKMQIKELTEFPTCFYNLTQLQTIELQNLYLFNNNEEPNYCFISQKVKNLKFLTTIRLRSLIHVEIDLNPLLQALTCEQKTIKMRSFELYNFIIDQDTLQQILKLKQINTLKLANGGIEMLPDSIAELKELVELSLPRNRLSSLPPALFTLTSLEKLNITKNPINRIPPQIMELSNLEELQMDVNYEMCNERDIKLAYQLFHEDIQVAQEQRFDIQLFQKQVEVASGFMELVQENQIVENQDQIIVEPYRFTSHRIISSFQAFTKLQFYRLTYLSLTDLELTIQELKILRMKSDLKHLKTLNLSRNRLKLYRDDECFTAWPQLTQLNLSYNLFEEMPSDITHLSKVEVLNLSHNKLKVISKELYYMQTLKDLDLSCNELQRVEFSLVEQKVMLRKLNLQQNNLQCIPTFVYQADQMESLNLSYNNQKCLLDKRLEKLLKLQSFKANFINNNCLLVFIFNLPQLKELQLNVAYNSAIPPQLPSLKYLKIVKLSLEGYNFRNIPSQIYHLYQSLTHLNLSNNMIEQLDQSVKILKMLKVLQLRYNPLEKGLDYLKKVTALQMLDLSFTNILYQNGHKVIIELKSQGVIVISSFEDEKVGVESEKDQSK